MWLVLGKVCSDFERVIRGFIHILCRLLRNIVSAGVGLLSVHVSLNDLLVILCFIYYLV